MTLERAIKVLANLGRPGFGSQTEEGLKARKLGISALERIRGLREGGHYIGMPLLKGETKEEREGKKGP